MELSAQLDILDQVKTKPSGFALERPNKSSSKNLDLD